MFRASIRRLRRAVCRDGWLHMAVFILAKAKVDYITKQQKQGPATAECHRKQVCDLF